MLKKIGKKNPGKTCFCCGKKIFNRNINSFYCKKCFRIVLDIKNVVYRIIKNKNIRKIPILKDYDFKIHIDVIKKQKI